MDLGADIDDAGLVEVLERLLRDVRDVAGDLLRTQLGVAGHHLEFLDVDRGEHVILDDPLGEQDRVLEVVAVPGHERDEHVAAERELAELGGRSVGDDLALLHRLADAHQRLLRDAGRLVRALEFLQAVDVDAGLGRVGLFRRADDDTGGVDLIDDAGAAGGDGRTRVAGDHGLHAGADEGRVGADQRHRLALHVRAHQRAVGVVVLEERDQRRRDRDELLGRHVHEIDAVGGDHDDLTRAAADHEVVRQLAARIHAGIGLGDVVLRLLHGGEVGDLVGHHAVLHPAERGLDEAVLVHAGEGRQRVDQADIRAFRRLDRADAAVMGRVHVAHLEAGALAGQTARAEGREAALVRHLRQRVGLVHELRELRRAEELAHGGRRGLRVDQVLRHHRVDIDRGHALLDGALHPQEAQTVLVLHQLADRADAAVAEVVDVVDLALAVAQVDQRLDHREHVLAAQRAHGVGGVEVEAHVHLHAADRGEVVALGVEEQRVKHRLRGVERRRLARAHDPVDVEQRALAAGILVDRQGVADVGADIDVVDVEHRDLGDADVVERLEKLLRDLVAGLGPDLAGLAVDEILGDVLADEILVGRLEELGALLADEAGVAGVELLAGFQHHLAGIGVDEIDRGLEALQALGVERHAPIRPVPLVGDAVVEGREDLLAVEAQREQQRGHRELALAVDAHVHDVLGVELDVEPGAAIRDDAGGKQQLAGRVRLALVVVEEHARGAVHLRDDDALGAVDDEGAVVRHERHVAHVDVLLLDVLDGLGAGVGIHVEHDQAQRHLERGREGDAALAALVDVVFRLLEGVAHEFEERRRGEVGDREDRLEDALEALVGAPALGLVHHQELVVGRLLNLDEVRHLGDFPDLAEELANALATDQRIGHETSLHHSA
ncbi:hypothetical protein CHKEEEPN_4361 [Methylorubrum podarium]|nr:hypothetical protein CHKEEEPN_4361 [Methylorubrum podarium]